jgi:acyl-CoA thioester hydrolase
MSKARHTLQSFLKANPVIFRAPVQWGEMDAFKHVNNVVYFKYQEGARIKYFDKLLQTMCTLKPATGPAFAAKWHAASGVGPILAHTELSYKFPVTFPDTLLVGASVDPATWDSRKGTRMKMTHDTFSLRHDRVVASGTGTIAIIDYATNQIAGAPTELVQALEQLQLQSSEHMLAALEEGRGRGSKESWVS